MRGNANLTEYLSEKPLSLQQGRYLFRQFTCLKYKFDRM